MKFIACLLALFFSFKVGAYQPPSKQPAPYPWTYEFTDHDALFTSCTRFIDKNVVICRYGIHPKRFFIQGLPGCENRYCVGRVTVNFSIFYGLYSDDYIVPNGCDDYIEILDILDEWNAGVRHD